MNMDTTRPSDLGSNHSKSSLLESLVSEPSEEGNSTSSNRIRGITSTSMRGGALASSRLSTTSRTPKYFLSQPLTARPTPTGVGLRPKSRLNTRSVNLDGPLPDFLRDKDSIVDSGILEPEKTTEAKVLKPSTPTRRHSRPATPEIAVVESETIKSSTQSPRPHSRVSVATVSSNTSRYSDGKMYGERLLVGKQRKESLLCEDVELSLEQSSSGAMRSLPVVSNYQPPEGVPITTEQAQELREALFGNARGSFNKEWLQQNLVFSDVPNLEFGLVQHKGGPCGVLACLQAHILKHLLFKGSTSSELSTSPRPTPEARSDALVQGMVEIIWRAGGKERAIVAMQSAESNRRVMKIGGLLTGSDIIAKMYLHEFTSERSLREFIGHYLNEKFMNSESSGSISFTLSVVLSRGVVNIRDDMDDCKTTLIGFHNYCTQELVNLIMTGYATSNVFDGEMCLGGTGPDKVILRGIKDPTEIGQLSLFEHYGSCKVGDYYKNPRYPIFVVCCESHFVVLFALIRKLTRNKHQLSKFDLYFYDGLANQKDIIRLTVQLDSTVELASEDLVPPIELCINTRWRSKIEWNGSEQLL